jgi:hypothetical protein
VNPVVAIAGIATGQTSPVRIRQYLPRVNKVNQTYVTTAGYAKSDLNASHRITDWATATLNVVNIGNQYNSDFGRLAPSLGRQTMFGVSLRPRW